MPGPRVFRVLVATDGSAQAGRAISMTTAFPWPADVRVRAVVARRIDAALGGPLLSALSDTADRIAKRAARRLLRKWSGVEGVVVDAAPVDGVLLEAKRFKADAIVVGWRGHGPVRRLLAGSVSRGIVRHATCAVLVVRRPPAVVRRVCIGADGSANAQRAVSFVERLSAPRNGQVILFRAVEQTTVPTNALAPPGMMRRVAAQVERLNQERIAAAKRDLARDAARLARRGWRVRVVMTTGAPLRDVLATVQRTKSHVLVVGARGTSGIERLLLGSIAEGALNRSRVPVLVVR